MSATKAVKKRIDDLIAQVREGASNFQPRHFAVKIAVRVGYGPIALGAEPIEETRETGIQPRSNRSPTSE